MRSIYDDSFTVFPNPIYLFFFFNDTATTEIYTLSLHDALPICGGPDGVGLVVLGRGSVVPDRLARGAGVPRRHHRKDRKSTRLNSSHVRISYAVFCLKKKKKKAEGHHYVHAELNMKLRAHSLP